MEDNTFGVSAALIYRLGLRNARPTFAAELETLSQAAIAAGTFVPPAGPLPGNLDERLHGARHGRSQRCLGSRPPR